MMPGVSHLHVSWSNWYYAPEPSPQLVLPILYTSGRPSTSSCTSNVLSFMDPTSTSPTQPLLIVCYQSLLPTHPSWTISHQSSTCAGFHLANRTTTFWDYHRKLVRTGMPPFKFDFGGFHDCRWFAGDQLPELASHFFSALLNLPHSSLSFSKEPWIVHHLSLLDLAAVYLIIKGSRNAPSIMPFTYYYTSVRYPCSKCPLQFPCFLVSHCRSLEDHPSCGHPSNIGSSIFNVIVCKFCPNFTDLFPEYHRR